MGNLKGNTGQRHHAKILNRIKEVGNGRSAKKETTKKESKTS